MLGLGYTQAKREKCLFYKLEENCISLIGLYVDDILVASHLKIRNDGSVEKFLGIHVHDDSECIALDLHH